MGEDGDKNSGMSDYLTEFSPVCIYEYDFPTGRVFVGKRDCKIEDSAQAVS